MECVPGSSTTIIVVDLYLTFFRLTVNKKKKSGWNFTLHSRMFAESENFNRRSLYFHRVFTSEGSLTLDHNYLAGWIKRNGRGECRVARVPAIRCRIFFLLHPLLSFPTSGDHMANITVNMMNPNAKWSEKLIFDMRCWFGFLTDAEEFLDM